MDMNEIYGNSDWLKAVDLAGKEWTLRIAATSVATMKGWDGQPKKQIVLKFFGAQKQLGLNRINAKRIEKMYGRNWEQDWIGKEVRLYESEAPNAKGNTVPCIRVRELPPAPTPFAPHVLPNAAPHPSVIMPQTTGLSAPPQPPIIESENPAFGLSRTFGMGAVDDIPF